MTPVRASRNNVVFFDHLFLGVGDMETAHTFYEQGLGLLYDPSVKSGQKKGVGVSWLSVGHQQVHIDQEEEVSRTPGPVKLLLPRLADIEGQLQKLQPRFVNTCFAFDFPPSPQAATVVDPWGQQFSVTDSSGKNPNSSSVEGLVLPCHPGTADAIAEFYRRIVGAEATEHTDDHGVYCKVDLGYGTSFMFREDPQLGSLETQKAVKGYEGWHCALYVLDFEETYSRVVQAGINQTDHPYKDKADTLEGAKQWNQFRFADIVALEDSLPHADATYRKGQLLYRFGHEIRSLSHRRCPKILHEIQT